MGTAEKSRAGIAPRAKSLGLGDSGVFAAVHEVAASGAANDVPEFEIRTAPTSSVRRDIARARAAAELDVWMRVAGVRNEDIGSSLGVTEPLVRRIRGNAAPFLAADIELIDQLVPHYLDALWARLRGNK